MAVAHFPSGSVLTCATFFETANAGDASREQRRSSDAGHQYPSPHAASPQSLELAEQTTPRERETSAPPVAASAGRQPVGDVVRRVAMPLIPDCELNQLIRVPVVVGLPPRCAR